LQKDPLTPNDPNLLMTILDNNSQGIKEFDNSFIKFSHQYKYFYINQSRKALHIYDLEEKAEENIIK